MLVCIMIQSYYIFYNHMLCYNIIVIALIYNILKHSLDLEVRH